MDRLDLSHPVQAAIGAAIVFGLALAAHRIGRRIVLRLVRGRPVWREVTRRIDLPSLALLPLLALRPSARRCRPSCRASRGCSTWTACC